MPKIIFREGEFACCGCAMSLVCARAAAQNLHGRSDIFTVFDDAKKVSFLVPPSCYWLV
jgi:hypothetical protein